MRPQFGGLGTMREAGQSIRIGILGPVVLDVPGGWHGALPPQQRKVLAVLAVNHGVPLSGEQIVRHVWGESPPDSAMQMVRNQIRGLRLLGRRGGSDFVQRGRIGYRLAEHVAVDADEFRTLVREGRALHAAGRAGDAVCVLERARVTWRCTEALADVRDVAELRVEAIGLEELRFQAEELIVDSHLALDRPEEALPILRAMTVLHPFREPAWLRLMAAQALAGRRAEASVDTYRQARRHLVEHTGLDAPLLTEVHRALLRGAHGRDLLTMVTGAARRASG
jgi:DNA-binding SARP family transcriptional activator